jgi:hypothetical protein
MWVRAFWDTAPCGLVELDRRFRGAYCLHHRDQYASLKRRSTTTRPHGVISQKALISIMIRVLIYGCGMWESFILGKYTGWRFLGAVG